MHDLKRRQAMFMVRGDVRHVAKGEGIAFRMIGNMKRIRPLNLRVPCQK